MDSGFLHVGLSAFTEKQELISADVELRNDIVKLNSERSQYRRARRNRKTWYRKPRFLNRKKPEGWVAPSIQHKHDSHVKLIEKVAAMLPVAKVVVEVSAFDIQKIKNPDIEGVDYQNGEQKGFLNAREYVLYRDGHKCQHCKGKSKDPILQVHHLESRQTGGDRPSNLLTLCKTCHDKVSLGQIVLKAKPSKGFKSETFMSMVRWKIVNTLKEKGFDTAYTYGYITKAKCIEIGLPKRHTNDAFVIADGVSQKRTETTFAIKQVRKCNRKLFKGDRSHLPNTAPRLVKGFQRFDKVLFEDKEAFIFGRRTTGYFDLRLLDGTSIHKSAKAVGLKLLERASTLLFEKRRRQFLPPLSPVGA